MTSIPVVLTGGGVQARIASAEQRLQELQAETAAQAEQAQSALAVVEQFQAQIQDQQQQIARLEAAKQTQAREIEAAASRFADEQEAYVLSKNQVLREIETAKAELAAVHVHPRTPTLAWDESSSSHGFA